MSLLNNKKIRISIVCLLASSALSLLLSFNVQSNFVPLAFFQKQDCSGSKLGTHCWYIGLDGESCTTVCSTHGGYNSGTLTYAGSAGTLVNCQALVDIFDAGSSAVDDAACTDAFGCCITGSSTDTRCTGAATTAGAAAAGTLRVCACNN